MFTVLIADDEPIIRRGIKKLIDWEKLGYCITGETGDGISTLEYILKNDPDVVLLDIKMPEIDGLEVMKRARQAGYNGKVIILSGYSDFTYAQEALRYNVSYYIRKPVDSLLLEQELMKLAKELNKEISDMVTIDLYKKKAADTIMKEIILGTCDFTQINLKDINMDASLYQVIIYEKYHQNFADTVYNFAELLRVANKNQNSFFTVVIDNNEIIILKNEYAIQKFKDFLNHFHREMKPQKGSPLDSLFITYGRIVYSPQNIKTSYLEAKQLMQRRFFCTRGQHTLGYEVLEGFSPNASTLGEESLEKYAAAFSSYLQTSNRDGLSETVNEIIAELYFTSEPVSAIKLFMTDLFLRIKEKLTKLFNTEISFPTNSQIIDMISKKYYLYEIVSFFQDQFEIILKEKGLSNKDAIIENVVYYIKNNYKENLRLEGIATAFGYNSSYLGQIFTAKIGCSFNSYLDKIRIEEACKLLADPNFKVYEISEIVGYKHVDYFHLKFKKHMNVSPLEYRRISVEENEN